MLRQSGPDVEGGKVIAYGRLTRLTADRNNVKRINRLIDDALRDPFTGIYNPEQLRHALTGARSRRITEEHRHVYLVDGDDLVILQAATTTAEPAWMASSRLSCSDQIESSRFGHSRRRPAMNEPDVNGNRH